VACAALSVNANPGTLGYYVAHSDRAVMSLSDNAAVAVEADAADWDLIN